LSWNGLWLTIPCQLAQWSMATITAHSCRIRWGQLFFVNNQNGLGTVSVCFRTIQHLVAIVMCKIWCDVWAEVLAHSPSSLDFAVISGWLHMWKKLLR
jgi:hypothetical protein